jgi:hypothetical protein
MKILFLVLSLFFSCASYSREIISPNKKIKVVLEVRATGPKGLGQAYF